jgi:hypothetical protein
MNCKRVFLRRDHADGGVDKVPYGLLLRYCPFGRKPATGKFGFSLCH